ncbi:MAG: nSTAND1 domain-containing NTPase [Luteolibacter sp.]
MLEQDSSKMSRRWLGLESFSETESTIFHGREQEISDLSRKVPQRRLTILFSQSGLGKTSLLRAGLFPRLRRSLLLPVYLRIDHSPSVLEPAEQIRKRLGEAMGMDLPEGVELSTWFHDRSKGISSGALSGVTPVLVFDQFEEVFTLGQSGSEAKSRSEDYLRQLSDLVEARPSVQLEKDFESGERDPMDFDFDQSGYRIVIAIREDFLSQLERCKQLMPSLMENRQPLDRLLGTKAMNCVMEPGRGIVTEDVAEAILRFVSGEEELPISEFHVEPAILSLVCQQLDRVRGDEPITAELLRGKRDQILEDYYDSCFEGMSEKERGAVEEHLVTESGFRENIATETLERAIGKESIDRLVALRLLHTESRDGRSRVELTHDVLTRFAVSSRQGRRERASREEREAQLARERRKKVGRLAVISLVLVAATVSCLLIFATRQRDIAETARKNAESSEKRQLALKEELRLSSSELSSAAKQLSSALLGGSDKGTSINLSTEALVTILPRLEMLQDRVIALAGDNKPALMPDAFRFHFEAAQAYGRNSNTKEALSHIVKAQKYLALIPDEKQRFRAGIDLKILEAEVQYDTKYMVDGIFPLPLYERIAEPLESAMNILDHSEESESASSRWRWLKASNLRARLDRHQNFPKESKARYIKNISQCEEMGSDDVRILRMHAEAINGLANVRVFRLWKEIAAENFPEIILAVSEYEKAVALRRECFERRQTDLWLKHELAISLENLASAQMLFVAGNSGLSKEEKGDLVGRATVLRRQRLEIHQEVYEGDRGNSLFATSYAYALSNLAIQEGLLSLDDQMVTPDEIAKWSEMLNKACVIAPDDLKIVESRVAVLSPHLGETADIQRYRAEAAELKKLKSSKIQENDPSALERD